MWSIPKAALERLAPLVPGLKSARPLGSGASGCVLLVEFASGETVVAKLADAPHGDGLAIEGRMLELLASRSRLPVPRVVHAEREVLLMEFIPGVSSFDAGAEAHAGRLLAGLHAVTSPDGRYGFDFEGVIGPLPQPNEWCSSWVDFFRDHRLRHMTEQGMREGRLGRRLGSRLDTLSKRLGELLPDSPRASLIHGDVWAGNVLATTNRVNAFLDPAPAYVHHEAELAFICLFSTFGPAFFDSYRDAGGEIDGDFWQTRRTLYNLYPLLVHARLFGGSYLHQIESSLDALGF